MLLALAFGERTALERALRTLMLKTGIAHLMAISSYMLRWSPFVLGGAARAAVFLPPI
ncbi:hypothetical protein M8494_16390 [Serratia ureilytica]